MSGAIGGATAAAGIISFPDLVTEGIGPGATFYTLHTDGTITYTGNTTHSLRWLRNGAPTNYEVSLAGGAYQSFSADRTINGTSTIDLRDKYTLAVVKSVTVTFI